MTSQSRRKQFVEVSMNCLIDGTIELKKITMANGDTFEIDESLDPYSSQSKPEGILHRYPITVRGKSTYLYEDGGRWWVLMKE